MHTDETFLTGCLENENVESNTEVDVAAINAKDEKHVFRGQIVSKGELRYLRRCIGDSVVQLFNSSVRLLIPINRFQSSLNLAIHPSFFSFLDNKFYS